MVGRLVIPLETIALAIMTLGALAAGAFEAWLVRRGHPRRRLYAWLAWTPFAMVFLGAAVGSSGNAGLALAVALLVGPLVYPIMSVLLPLHLRMNPSPQKQAWEDLQRMRYRATDFGGVARPRPGDGAVGDGEGAKGEDRQSEP